MPGLAPDSQVDLQVAADGFASEEMTAVGPTNGDTLEVVLEPDAVIEGRVTYRGEPVRTWVAVHDDGAEDADDLRLGLGSVSTDTDGAFRFPGLKPGRYSLVARPPPGLETGRTSVLAVASRTVEADIRLTSGQGVVEGRISRNGAAHAGVRVSAAGVATTSDGSGRYRLTGLPRTGVLVAAERDGTGNDPVRLVRRVDLQAGRAVENFDFSTYDVSGRAFLADGAPAGRTRLSFTHRDDPLGIDGRARATTSADGAFAVRLHRGFWSVCGGDGWFGDGERCAEKLVRVRGPSTNVRVRLPAATLTIRGRAFGLSPRELVAFQVEARNDRLDSRAGATTADGEFRIHGLRPGSWLIVGTVPSSGRRAESRVKLGEEPEDVVLEFERLPELSGTVFLDGTPLAGTQVLLVRGRDIAGARRGWTRHDGSWRFVDLPPGDYTLGVGAGMREVKVRQDQVVDIRLQSGAITGTAGERPGAAVQIWPAAASRAEAEAFGLVRRSFTDEGGRFAFLSVPEGSWKLGLAGGRRAERTVEVAPGTVVEADIR